jgi:PIN domain nuclease of toxin-antitoxin system
VNGTIAPLLLDTCALIWGMNDDRLDDDAVAALDAASDLGQPVYLSPITAWEIGLLVARGRLTITSRPKSWFAEALEVTGTKLAALPPEVLIEASFLPGEPPADPADRIIIATAREFGMRIVTRDRAILSYAKVGHAMALEC